MSPSAAPPPDPRPAERSGDTAPRRPPKAVHVFALQAAVVLGLLAWLPMAASVYAGLAHAEGNTLFGSLGDGRRIAFEWVEPESRVDRSDTLMEGLVDGESRRRWRAVFSIRRRGYWPSAVWVALTFATPMSRVRRGLVLPVGLGLLNVFLMGQLAWIGLSSFGATLPAPAGPDSLWLRTLPVATVWFNSPIPTYAFVFVIWAGLARPQAGIDVAGATRLIRRKLLPR